MKIIMCRHADHHDGNLTDHGRGQATQLGNRIRGEVVGLPVCAHSSTARRARQTLEIVAQVLEISAIGYDAALGSDESNPYASGIISLIESVSSRFGAVVLITHQPGEVILRGYASMYDQPFNPLEFQTAEGFVIDTESRTLKHLAS